MTVIAAILFVTANTAGKPTLTEVAARDYARIIQAEADRFEIDPLILVALVDKESDWHAGALNPKTGATGLMQIIASPEMLAGGFEQFIEQIQDPRVNVFLGARRLNHFRRLCHGDIWRAVDAYDSRGTKRKGLSSFALEVKARRERIGGAVVAEAKGGR